MRFTGLKNIFEIHVQLQLEACWGDVIMTVGGEDKSQKYFWDRKMNLRKVTMKYDGLVVFIRVFVTIQLRYGGLGMDSHLSLVL
jgi:hypothetical protein